MLGCDLHEERVLRSLSSYHKYAARKLFRYGSKDIGLFTFTAPYSASVQYCARCQPVLRRSGILL